MLQSEKTTEQQGRRGNIFIGSVFGMLFSSITSHRRRHPQAWVQVGRAELVREA